MIILDTDVLIEVIRRGVKPGDWAISIITLIEFLRGVSSSKVSAVKDRLERAFTETYCRLYRKLKKRDDLISDADLLIAATSIALKIPLATLNVKHFNRLRREGLELVNLAQLGLW